MWGGHNQREDLAMGHRGDLLLGQSPAVVAVAITAACLGSALEAAGSPGSHPSTTIHTDGTDFQGKSARES